MTFKLETNLKSLVDSVQDYCFTNGLIYFRPSENINERSNDLANQLPVTLFPTIYPRSEFQYALSIQTEFQKMIFQISQDYNFLKEALKTVIQVDDFTKRLWNIYDQVHTEGITQPITLGIIRNDYMLDQNKSIQTSPTQLSQIEINTISCSFGAATSKVSNLHAHCLRITDNTEFLSQLAHNDNLEILAKGLVNAWQMYENENSILVFLVIDLERNIGDQRLLEYECLKLNSKLKILRYTIQDFAERGQINSDKTLLIDGSEVGLVYFRACYDPNHFKSDQDWNARLLIERSKAIKCPNIQAHLVGAKIVQTTLFEPGVVEKFVQDLSVAQKLRATFVDLYSITKENLSQIIDLIDEKSDEFVLKPQREGGGHNIYKEDIRKFVDSLSDKSDLMGYILMKLVKPYTNENYVVRTGEQLAKKSLISELGIFGFYISNGDKIIQNQTGGYLLRTKSFDVNEGGVATGFSALDSLCLI
ncbi:unnamed protein product [Brachionus calyciflorus]|uniref:Glutathione synthetase n=1 Tax=Brachionus calyciflorus TaxID=104777 RepID=A0A814BEN6_9BILA|nr:unnamed protein product [Brachionus calyciflorus]